MPVGGKTGKKHHTDLDSEDDLPSTRLPGPRSRNVPDAGKKEDRVGRPLHAGNGTNDLFPSSSPSDRIVGSSPATTICPPTHTVAARM